MKNQRNASASPGRSKKDYPLLLAGQFLGAFGDNFLFAAIVAPLTFKQEKGEISEQFVNLQNALFALVFFVPFIVLAPLAGYLNDRMPKTAWLFGGNLVKLAGAGLGLAAVMAHQSDFEASRPWQLLAYALMGVGACLYSPAKYGILPELLPRQQLVRANGTVEMLTLIAIVAGVGGGGVMYDYYKSMTPCYVAGLGLYGAALLLNLAMTRSASNEDASLRGSTLDFARNLKRMLAHRRLGCVLLGCAIFWFGGAAARNNLQAWGLHSFQEAGFDKINNLALASLKVVLVFGIVAGSVLAGRLHATGDLSWARRYAWLMAASLLGLGLVGGHGLMIPGGVLLMAAGVAAGLLLVPLNAAIQSETSPKALGKTISVQNFVDYVAMATGTAFLWALSKLNLSPSGVFVGLAAALALLAVFLRIPPGSKDNS